MRSLGSTEFLHTLTTTLCLLAKRWLLLADEVEKLDAMLDALTHQHARRLREQFGVGPQTAAVLLSTAGDNPERLRNEASLAALCGVNPLPASSGKTVRHRLNRGGNRAANNALWTIAMVRMRGDPQTQSYVARRRAQGLSSKEIQRCLKRYIVRELYPLILADLADSARACWHRSVNAPMERLFRSLKTEWLPTTGYMNLREAKRDISYYLMDYYNWRRPHQHNDGIAPAKAEDRPNQVSGFS